MAFKKKPEEVKAGAPEYMNTYGDMITLMLCFFVLLYSMSNIDINKFQELVTALSGTPVSVMSGGTGIFESGSGIMQMPTMEQRNDATASKEQADETDKTVKEAQEELNRMASDFKTYFSENNMEEKVNVTVGDFFIEFTLSEGISFDSGKANLKDEITAILDMLGNELEKYPGTEISVEGHTDDIPISTPQFPSNWYLSSARAISVGEYLINEKGIDPGRIDARGRGEYRPIDTNETVEGRAKNRRVEIKVYSSLYSNVS